MNAVSSHAAAAQGCSTQLAQDFLAGWSHNTPKLLSIFADDLVYEDTTVHAVLHGKEELRGFADGWFKAFPDLSFTYKNAVVSGDRAAVEWEATGTQKGDMPGMPGSSPCWTAQTVRSSTSLTIMTWCCAAQGTAGSASKRRAAIFQVLGPLHELPPTRRSHRRATGDRAGAEARHRISRPKRRRKLEPPGRLRSGAVDDHRRAFGAT